MHIPITPVVVLLLPAAFATAEPALQIIELRHRSAEELTPILRPLAGPGAGVSGKNHHLFLRVSDERLQELKPIIEKLDIPARQWMISVLQGRFSDRIGDGARRHETRHEDDVTQRIRTSDGKPAFIATGRLHPLPRTAFGAGPGGAHVASGTEYRAATGGFYALPRVQGDRVTVELAPHMTRKDDSGDAFSISRAVTTVSGRLGEWIEIGGAAGESLASGAARAHHYATRRTSDIGVWLKVEAVDDMRINATPPAPAGDSPPANTGQ